MFETEVDRVGAGFDGGLKLRPVAGGTHDLGFGVGDLHGSHLCLGKAVGIIAFKGDWGGLDDDDKEENEFSLQRGLRLLSAHTLKDGTYIWIIIEADRSVTTLLLPSEY